MITTEQSFTPVSAAGPYIAWSRQAGLRRPYRLVLSDARRASVLPVKPRDVPFDASVGRDARGRFVVTYSRCRREGAPRTHVGGRGCRLFEYDIEASRERRIASGTRAGAGLAWPVRAGRRLIFVRTDGGRGRDVPQLHLRVDGRPGARLLAGGSHPRADARITGLVMRGSTVAFTWVFDSGDDACGQGAQSDVAYSQQYELWRGRLGGGLTLLDRTCGSADRAVGLASPALSDGRVTSVAQLRSGGYVLRSVSDAGYEESAPLAGTIAWAIAHRSDLVVEVIEGAFEYAIHRWAFPALEPSTPLESGTRYGAAPGFTKPFGRPLTRRWGGA